MDENELKTALTELKADIAKHGYVYARASGLNREKALKEAGRSKTWLYELPKDELERLEMLACELAAIPKVQAQEKLEAVAVEAVDVLIEELGARDARLRVDVAKDVLNRLGIGVQAQKVEVSGEVKHSLIFNEIIAGGDTD